jgi:hypothetical protein
MAAAGASVGRRSRLSEVPSGQTPINCAAMRRTALLLLLCVAWAAPGAALARPPIVVELFTAQGCSSCGKANALVKDLADRADVIALTWPVDYWDYLGWKDTFAKPEFTDRQRAYDRRLGVRDVYTPQVIVDGTAQVSGAKAEAVDRLIRDALRAPADPPDMKVMENGRVAVGYARPPRGGGEVWLVRYDPREQDIEVTAGDARGQIVPHRNVVRQVVRLGAWTGRPALYRAPPAAEDGLETLVLVQAKNGKMLGVLKVAPVAKITPKA